MYLALFVVSLAFVRISTVRKEWTNLVQGLVAVMASTFGTVIMPNLVALIMSKGLNKGMSWFSNPFSPIALYAPPALLGALLSQYLVGPVFERDILNALLVLQCGLAYGIQMAGIGSAGLFFLSGLPLFIALLSNRLITGNATDISLITYAIAQLEPLLIGSLMLTTVSEVFVPLVSQSILYQDVVSKNHLSLWRLDWSIRGSSTRRQYCSNNSGTSGCTSTSTYCALRSPVWASETIKCDRVVNHCDSDCHGCFLYETSV